MGGITPTPSIQTVGRCDECSPKFASVQGGGDGSR